MFGRQKSGSAVCPNCGRLVGVKDRNCYSCGRPYPAFFGYSKFFQGLGRDFGLIRLVIFGCGALWLATLAFDVQGIQMGGLFNMAAPSGESLFVFGASGPTPVFGYGRWWTVLSAGWLHGGLLHIGFNLYWLWILGPATAEHYGPGRMMLIYTIGSVTGFAASSLSIFVPGFFRFIMGGGGGITVGASAAVFGLLGSLVYYGRRGSSAVSRQAWLYAVILGVMGLVMRGTDNWAHLGGFVGGYLAGQIMNPLKPERLDHLVGAGLCLLLTAIAVALSFFTGLDLIRR